MQGASSQAHVLYRISAGTGLALVPDERRYRISAGTGYAPVIRCAADKTGTPQKASSTVANVTFGC